jgi:hypothetical protein
MKTIMFTDCVITVSVTITESQFITSLKDVFQEMSERNAYLCISHGMTAKPLGLEMPVKFFSTKFHTFPLHDLLFVFIRKDERTYMC